MRNSAPSPTSHTFNPASRTLASEPFSIRAKRLADEAFGPIVFERVDHLAGGHIPDRDVLAIVGKYQMFPVGREVQFTALCSSLIGSPNGSPVSAFHR